jgi:O-acetyl-ADP-ribose deacetylase (regulator of RNase III)
MIHYLIGDATEPTVSGPKIIAQICNDKGRWGSGFVLALSKKWPQPEDRYRALTPEQLQLGFVQLVTVTPEIMVANMIAQHGTKPLYVGTYGHGIVPDIPIIPPIRYEALRSCLRVLNMDAHALHATIHMPRIGCGLAGATWDMILPIIEETLPYVEVYVYDLI